MWYVVGGLTGGDLSNDLAIDSRRCEAKHEEVLCVARVRSYISTGGGGQWCVVCVSEKRTKVVWSSLDRTRASERPNEQLSRLPSISLVHNARICSGDAYHDSSRDHESPIHRLYGARSSDASDLGGRRLSGISVGASSAAADRVSE